MSISREQKLNKSDVTDLDRLSSSAPRYAFELWPIMSLQSNSFIHSLCCNKRVINIYYLLQCFIKNNSGKFVEENLICF